MCGRFAQFSALETLKRYFPIDTVACDVSPSYNIAPTQEVPAIIRIEENLLVRLRWGLVPFWVKDLSGAPRLINARLETVAEKPSFRNAFKHRRCLILADGFFEWTSVGNLKQPWFLSLPSKQPFAFAGLWETRKGDTGTDYRSCTIITTSASDAVRKIHHRMPVVLKPEAYGAWLNPENRDTAGLKANLQNLHIDNLVGHGVSKFVNSPRNNSEKCIEPVAEPEDPQSAQLNPKPVPRH
jgi:putative SOS response-associated peptidase YedK